MKEIRCQYTQDLVCPHCGYSHGDSWMFQGQSGEENSVGCMSCDKEFFYVTNVEVTFSSSKHQEEE